MTSIVTQRYKTIKTEEGFRFIFYCDFCDYKVETSEIKERSYYKALMEAKEYAKRYFNRCRACHMWVCDEHYNEDEMQCVSCKPHQNKIVPMERHNVNKVCGICGNKYEGDDCFCKKCGARIQC